MPPEVTLHYLFTPTLALPLKGEGIFEIVSYRLSRNIITARGTPESRISNRRRSLCITFSPPP